MARSKKVKEEVAPLPPVKKYSVVYTIPGDTTPTMTDGDDYKVSMMDIQSPHTQEVSSFPVIFVMNHTDDTMDIIPIQIVGLIRHNFGVAAEANQFITEMEAMKKKVDKADKKNPKVKKIPEEHDRQYV